MEIYERIQKLKGKGRQILAQDPDTLAELNDINYQLYRERIKAGCGNCHMTAYGRLIKLTPETINIMATQKFKLKKGVAIQVAFGSGDFITNENLTDEKAIRLLRNRPMLLKEFAEYPKDAAGKLVLPAEPKKEAAKKAASKKAKAAADPKKEATPATEPKKEAAADDADTSEEDSEVNEGTGSDEKEG